MITNDDMNDVFRGLILAMLALVLAMGIGLRWLKGGKCESIGVACERMEMNK